MRGPFIASFLANLALAAVAAAISPPTVAIHFGRGGAPNDWAPSHVNAILMVSISVLVFVSFYFAPHLTRVTPDRWINLPNKQYWLKPGNRGRMEAILSRHLYGFGTVTFALLFAVGLLALKANLSRPVRFREDLFWWPFGVYILYVVQWIARVFLAFRVPTSRVV